jgi:hypothetical protein
MLVYQRVPIKHCDFFITAPLINPHHPEMRSTSLGRIQPLSLHPDTRNGDVGYPEVEINWESTK